MTQKTIKVTIEAYEKLRGLSEATGKSICQVASDLINGEIADLEARVIEKATKCVDELEKRVREKEEKGVTLFEKKEKEGGLKEFLIFMGIIYGLKFLAELLEGGGEK